MITPKEKAPVKVAKKSQQNADLVVQNIIIRQPVRRALDVTNWRNALIAAENPRIGRRTILYDLYLDVMLDNVLGDAIDKRIMAITNSSIVFTTSNGDPVPEIEELMMSDDFELMLTEIMNSKFWGITVLEFDFTTGFHATNIPRKHINALTGEILIQQSDLEGYPYRDDPFFLEAGTKDDLGLILKAALYVIYKRGGFGDWAQFTEIFGQPFRKGTYNNYDDYTRKQLEQALSTTGGAPWVVIPKDGNIEYIENHANGDGRLYKLLLDACNQEILIGILGQTMTTVAGSSKAQSQTHKEVEESINKSDRRFIQRVLNQKFLPILEARGYPVKGGKFDFPEAESDMTLTERFNIDSQLNEIIPMDQEYFYATYGIPKPEGELAQRKPLTPINTGQTGDIVVPVKVPPGKPDKKGSMLARMTLKELFGFFHKTPTAGPVKSGPMSGGSQSLSLPVDAGSLDSTLIEGIAKEIHAGNYPTRQTNADLALFTSNTLMNGLKQNVDNWDDLSPDDEGRLKWINVQQNNIYKFGLAKSYSQLKGMRDQVVGPDGKITPYTEFLKSVMATNDQYNKTWLATEYDAVVRGTVMGTRWQDIEDQKDVTPYLQYVTAGDDRVRPEHEELEGIIEPVDSPFWNQYYPPNGWNCRCSVDQLSDRQADHSGYKEDETSDNMKLAGRMVPDPYWRKNTGKTAIMEADKTAYINAVPGKGNKQLKAVENYGMKPSEQIMQNANLPVIERQTKEEFEHIWRLNEAKGIVDVKDENELPVRFDDDFYKHMLKGGENHYGVGGELFKVVKNPDEIWAQQKSSRRGEKWLKVYLKYYKGKVITIVVDDNGNAKSLYEIEEDNIENYRKGILLKKK
jgi:SPP1 gp7 family putative phage head morphogenesis protein